MAGVYKTKQRDIVFMCLAQNADRAPTPKEIHVMCRDEGTPVGLATIYRQLDCLTAENAIKKIAHDDGSIGYQYIAENSRENGFYLKCICCGRVIPADCELLSDVQKHMDNEHGFAIDPARSLLYGLCGECK